MLWNLHMENNRLCIRHCMCKILFLIVLCDTKLPFFSCFLCHCCSISSITQRQIFVSIPPDGETRILLEIPVLCSGKFQLLAYIRSCLVANDAWVPPSLFLLYGLSWCTVEVVRATWGGPGSRKVWDYLCIMCCKASFIPTLILLGYFYAVLQYMPAFLSVVW